MILVQDNFLPNSHLSFFKQLSASVTAEYLSAYKIWKKFFISENKHNSTIVEFGPFWEDTCERIQRFVKQDHDLDIFPYCARLQVCHETHAIYKHKDGPVRNNPLEKSYSSILYINDIWDNTHGGEIRFSEKSIEPVYNRLVFYSRDEAHEVLPPKKDWSKPRAIVMFSWDS
jgi:Rps23 Pro-64 3,4-dihydroxylase Tpa1-like proline 4-hydroxylase